MHCSTGHLLRGPCGPLLLIMYLCLQQGHDAIHISRCLSTLEFLAFQIGQILLRYACVKRIESIHVERSSCRLQKNNNLKRARRLREELA